MSETTSILVLIDEANLTKMFKERGKRIEWVRFRELIHEYYVQWLGDIQSQIYVFVGLPPVQYHELREKKIRFLQFLDFNNFGTVVRQGQMINLYNNQPVSYKANVDVMLAVKGMSLAHTQQPDRVLLITGDGDFEYLVHTLQNDGFQVDVAGMSDRTNLRLRQTADYFIMLDNIVPEMPDLYGIEYPPLSVDKQYNVAQ